MTLLTEATDVFAASASSERCIVAFLAPAPVAATDLICTTVQFTRGSAVWALATSALLSRVCQGCRPGEPGVRMPGTGREDAVPGKRGHRRARALPRK